MRFHGLVSIAVLGLSTRALAQNDSVPAPRNTFPPAVRQPESQIPEPSPRALLGDDLDAASSIEAELRQFRSELREFQSVREEVAHSAQTVDRDNDRISLQQRKDLVELLTRLAKKGVGRKPAVASAVPAPGLTPTPSTAPMESEPMVEQPREIDVEISDEVADPFALGKVLFRAGDFVNAEKAFRKVNATSENAPTLNYLIATCLRRQSKWQSAVDVYKVVAESDQDPVLRDLAKWQLENIQWHRQSEAQLEQMRRDRDLRLEAATKPPVNAPAKKVQPPRSASTKRTIR